MSRPFHYRDWLDVLIGALIFTLIAAVIVTFIVTLVLINISLIGG